MAEGRAGYLRHSASSLASLAASPPPSHDNDILDRAILEAQKLLENLKRVRATTGPIETRDAPATRRASRRQSSSAANHEQDEVREIAETSWEITRQQNGLVSVVIRKLEGEGKLALVEQPLETKPRPSKPLPALRPTAPPPGPSPTHHLNDLSEILREFNIKEPPKDSPKTLSHHYLDDLPEILPNYHPDDLPEIQPNYHPDDLRHLSQVSPDLLKKLSFDFLSKSILPNENEDGSSEREGNLDGDGTTLVDLSVEQPQEIAPLKQTCGEHSPVAPQPNENLLSAAGIKHRFDGSVLVVYPSMEQWLDFPNILAFAREHGAGVIGAFKVQLSEAMLKHLGPRNREDPVPRPKKPCIGYRSRRLPNRTFNVTTTNDHRVFRRSDPSPLTLAEAVRYQEHLLRKKQGLKGVFYRTDIPVQTPEEREQAGLPPRSAIWPLDGDMLRHTKQEIPGIHWPYGYESAAEFGALFALHNEDFNLHSVSHLHHGRKIWIMVPPGCAETLEEKMRETDPSIGRCGQCIRHRSLFVPTTLLEEWRIPYTLVDQRAPEIVITMPRTYHSGFSTGYTLAEASNYADSEWRPAGYASCPHTCPDYPIDGALMEFLGPGETQKKHEVEAEAAVEDKQPNSATNASVSKAQVKENASKISKASAQQSRPTSKKKAAPAPKKLPVLRGPVTVPEQKAPMPSTQNSGPASDVNKRPLEQSLAPMVIKKQKIEASGNPLVSIEEPNQPVVLHRQATPLMAPPLSVGPIGSA